jgi:hypothetical protein
MSQKIAQSKRVHTGAFFSDGHLHAWPAHGSAFGTSGNLSKSRPLFLKRGLSIRPLRDFAMESLGERGGGATNFNTTH